MLPHDDDVFDPPQYDSGLNSAPKSSSPAIAAADNIIGSPLKTPIKDMTNGRKSRRSKLPRSRGAHQAQKLFTQVQVAPQIGRDIADNRQVTHLVGNCLLKT